MLGPKIRDRGKWSSGRVIIMMRRIFGPTRKESCTVRSTNNTISPPDVDADHQIKKKKKDVMGRI
jgi:hypothetical protein